MTHSTVESILPEDFDKAAFLRDYWQQKPLLIRAGSLSFIDPITPEELAGLACEEGVESRLVQVDAAQQTWRLREGPFAEQDFLSLPSSHYSLLVQAVDQWVDDVSALLEDFDFIPGWRVDDVMISYSTDQGNVGPHFDYYDVFLIQGAGRKRWQIGQQCSADTPLDSSSGLKLLTHFQVEQEYDVHPGDILYIPPGYAHFGIAEGSAITYSVGFRAPSWADVASGVVDDLMDDLTEDQRYQDPAPALPMHYGAIPDSVIDHLQQQLLQMLTDKQRIRRWFGCYMTQPRYPLAADDNGLQADSHTLRGLLTEGTALYKVPGARFAYSNDDTVQLFADGAMFQLPMTTAALNLVRAISAPGYLQPIAQDVLQQAIADDHCIDLLSTLLQHGSLMLDE